MRNLAVGLFVLLACGVAKAPDPPVSFKAEVQPLLQSRCMPCHFSGGKMYARLPFDQPVTLVTLGDKLFTRIKDPKSQALLRKYLAQSAKN